jgi:uncharacterized phiE125 gp8 family phage protein
MKVVVPVDPADEPITLEEARHHLRVDTYGSPATSDDDDWLTDIGIPAARMWAEGYTGLSLAPQTIEIVARQFPAEYFELPFGPVQAIVSVEYTDALGVPQPFTDYELDGYRMPAVLQPAYGFTWPTALDWTNSVRVRYQAGYSLPSHSPAGFVLTSRLKIGILLMLGHLYENREDTSTLNLSLIPNGARTFLDFDRTRRGFA